MTMLVARQTTKRYDVVVIGGGSAGVAAAEAARAQGVSVCVVERDRLGGECPHTACVPTKTLLRSATLYHAMRGAAEFGLHVRGLSFRYRAIAARRKAIVSMVTGNERRLPERMERLGITVVWGEAMFVDAQTIRVGTKRIRAKAFVIATGTEDVIPPIAGIEQVPYLTSRTAVALNALPSSFVIVGGGPVGAECATAFSLLRSRVMLIEAGDRILPREDAEIAALAAASLRGHGVDVRERSRVLAVARSGPGIRVTYQVGTAPRRHVATAVLLVAAGRRPRVRALGLETTGMQLTDKGTPMLDAHGRTTQRHIVVAGDAAGGWQFTHTAHREGALTGRIAAGKQPVRVRSPLVVPRVTFLEPEVASVGMTEYDARKAGGEVHVARLPLGVLSRSVIDGHRDGLLKMLIGKNGRILGGHMMGPRAGEVVHEIALAMHAGVPFDELVSLLHAFPTYAEAIPASAAYWDTSL